jgi:hypothetical protein
MPLECTISTAIINNVCKHSIALVDFVQLSPWHSYPQPSLALFLDNGADYLTEECSNCLSHLTWPRKLTSRVLYAIILPIILPIRCYCTLLNAQVVWLSYISVCTITDVILSQDWAITVTYRTSRMQRTLWMQQLNIQTVEHMPEVSSCIDTGNLRWPKYK